MRSPFSLQTGPLGDSDLYDNVVCLDLGRFYETTLWIARVKIELGSLLGMSGQLCTVRWWKRVMNREFWRRRTLTPLIWLRPPKDWIPRTLFLIIQGCSIPTNGAWGILYFGAYPGMLLFEIGLASDIGNFTCEPIYLYGARHEKKSKVSNVRKTKFKKYEHDSIQGMKTQRSLEDLLGLGAWGEAEAYSISHASLRSK